MLSIYRGRSNYGALGSPLPLLISTSHTTFNTFTTHSSVFRLPWAGSAWVGWTAKSTCMISLIFTASVEQIVEWSRLQRSLQMSLVLATSVAEFPFRSLLSCRFKGYLTLASCALWNPPKSESVWEIYWRSLVVKSFSTAHPCTVDVKDSVTKVISAMPNESSTSLYNQPRGRLHSLSVLLVTFRHNF